MQFFTQAGRSLFDPLASRAWRAFRETIWLLQFVEQVASE